MLKFAIVGCGAIGGRHAKHASATGELRAVCDIVFEKAERLAGEYGARAYRSLSEMLAAERELDVAAVCTPNGLHAEHSIQALEAGVHVLCEKPMALRVVDCVAMVEAAARAGRRLFVVKQNRFNPPVQAVKQLLDRGALGRIYSISVTGIWSRGPAYYKDSWHGSADLDGGILYTQFSHFIDLLYYMVGEAFAVEAFSDNFAHAGAIEFEDSLVAILRMKAGALATVHFSINSYQENMEGSVMLVTEKGTVKIGGQYLNTLEFLRYAEGTEIVLPGGHPANDYGGYKGSMSNHDKMYAHVAETIRSESLSEFDGQVALKTVEMIEQIYQSIK